MSMFSSPQEHAANPPDSWQVVKVAEHAWRLTTLDGTVLEQCSTKRAAEQLKVEGFYVRQYEKEGRWYAGEVVSGWRPYKELA